MAGSTEVANDLDIYYVKDGGGTTRGSSTTWDDTAEYVSIPSGYTPGTWTIRVKGYSLSSTQSFGLAAHPIMQGADLDISVDTEDSVSPGQNFYYHQYVSNNGYTAGGAYARLYVPSGFSVNGERVYINNGYSHYYTNSEIYHTSGSNYWRVAFGEVIGWYPRHVRWYIRANPTAAPGMYRFMDTAYWRRGGGLYSSGDGFTYVSIGEKTLLPSVLKNH